MRKRIQDLSRGKFIYEEPDVVLSSELLELTVYQNENASGSVKLICKNGIIQKGIVYSTLNRMECKQIQFEKEIVEIPYEFHSEGLDEGDVLRGRFVFICNKGEYYLPFVVEIKKYYELTSRGLIQSLGQFLALAHTNELEAHHLYCQSYFSNIMDERDVYARMLYECLGGPNASREQMEEYLITMGLKEPISYSLESKMGTYNDLIDNQMEKIRIKKEGWGYNHFHIVQDSDFLQPLYTDFSTDDFIGQEIEVSFLIDVKMLGKGKHHGRIFIRTGNQELAYLVEIHQDTQGSLLRNKRLEFNKNRNELEQSYVLYRVGKLTVALWAERSLELVEKLKGSEVSQSLLLLYQAQILFFSGRKQEASWILDAYKKEKASKDTPEYGYYLYLTSLINREHSYVQKVADKVEQIYQKNQTSFLLFWIRLFVREEFARYKGRRLQVILDRLQKGCNSPVLYAEGYHLVKEEPFLLHDLSKPVFQLLHWIAQKDLMTKDLVQRIVELTQGMKFYSKTLHQVLEKGYVYWPNREVVQAICQNLLRGQRYGNEYYPWYQAGVEEELHITNLYEAYLMCIQDWTQITYPKVIQYYIKFKTRLPMKQRAALYAGMVRNKEQEKMIYSNAQMDIERFVLDHLSEEKIDDNLAILYEDYLENHFLNKELAAQLAKVFFVRKFECNRKDIMRLHIFQSGIKQVLQVPVTKQVAYFPILSDVTLIGLEDKNGAIHVDQSTGKLHWLMKSDHSIYKFLKAAPEQEEYWIYHFLSKSKKDDLEEFEIAPLQKFLECSQISELRKRPFFILLLLFYKKAKMTEQMDELLGRITIELYSLEHQVLFIETMIERQLFSKALQELKNSNYMEMKLEYLLILIAHQIEELDYQVDDYLLLVAFYLFEQKNYNSILLKYLVLYYYGTSKQMEELWLNTKGMELPTFDLKERILVQMLYTETFLLNSDEIFQQYMEEGGKNLIRDAYLSYYSFGYVMREAPFNPFSHGRIEVLYEKEEELNEVEKLALLKGYSQQSGLRETQMDHAYEIYQEFAQKKFRMKFFLDLPKQITSTYPLDEWRIVEHRCKPGIRPVIEYRIREKEFIQEEMQQLFPGIFQKEFLLFFGDILEYSIHEWKDEDEEIVLSNTVENCEFTGEEETCLYDYVNGIIYQNTIGEQRSATMKLSQLLQKKRWVRENFGLME